MQKTEHIVRYTAAELEQMRQRGEGQTDWDRVNALTDEEIEASIDHEDEGAFDMSGAQPGLPAFLQQQTVTLDPDILNWLQTQGTDIQSRVNTILREHIKTRQQ